MPQIWLTYSEIDDFIEDTVGSGEVRKQTLSLDRRRCSDGETRVKLPADVISKYIAWVSNRDMCKPERVRQ